MCSSSGEVGRVDAVSALASAANQLAGRDLDTLGDAQLSADVEALTRICAQVTAERLRCAAAVAGRAPDAAAGRQHAQRLLQTAGRLSGGQAARETRLATALADPRLDATAAGIGGGQDQPSPS